MDSLYLLIPIALLFCFIAIKLLLWAIDNGQYDDLDKEAYRILMDEPEPGEDDKSSACNRLRSGIGAGTTRWQSLPGDVRRHQRRPGGCRRQQG